MMGSVLAMVLCIFVSVAASGSEMNGVLKNNAGVRKMNQKHPGDAMGDFTAALSEMPFSGEVHFNIGNSFLLRREYEKALSEYDVALKSSRGDSRRERETRFRALFNSAVVQTELKKRDVALDLYQKALDLKPDSLEAKTNIELLTQQNSGDGQGDQQKDQDDKGKESQGDQKDKKDQAKKFENPRSTPRPFKSEELSQSDVKRILEELKRQEEQIRARMQNEQRKDAPPEKDW